jgi:hypothetical protein
MFLGAMKLSEYGAVVCSTFTKYTFNLMMLGKELGIDANEGKKQI